MEVSTKCAGPHLALALAAAWLAGLSHPKAEAPPIGFVAGDLIGPSTDERAADWPDSGWMAPAVTVDGVATPELTRVADLEGLRTVIGRGLVLFPLLNSGLGSRRQDLQAPAAPSLDEGGSATVVAEAFTTSSVAVLVSFRRGFFALSASPTEVRVEAGAEIDCCGMRAGSPITPTALCPLTRDL